MWFARDIKSKILTRLADNTNGLSALITTVNSERTETTALPFRVNAEKDEGQYPAVFVDLGDSIIGNAIGTEYNEMAENFNLEITALLMGSEITKLKNDCENYIEAILRCLEGYKEQDNYGSYICEANTIQRADIDTIQDQTKRVVTVVFTIYSNQL